MIKSSLLPGRMLMWSSPKILMHSGPPNDPIQNKALYENCILINDKDEMVGAATKQYCHRVNDDRQVPLHRGFSVLVFNSKKELLIQKRSSYKIMFPSHMSTSCCSHPLYKIVHEREMKNELGVRYAAQRSLNTELGIQIKDEDLSSLQYVRKLRYKTLGNDIWGENQIVYVFVLYKDVEINPNPNEVSDVFYISNKELGGFLSKMKVPLAPWFKYLIQSNQIYYWWDNLHNLDVIQGDNHIPQGVNI